MAKTVEAVEVPVKLLGIDNAMEEAVKAVSKMEVDAAKKLESLAARFQNIVDDAMRRAGVEEGRFRTQTRVSGEALGAGFEEISEVGLRAGFNPQKEAAATRRENEQHMQRIMKLGELARGPLETVDQVNEAIKAQVDAVDALQEMFDKDEIGPDMLMKARKDLEQLVTKGQSFRTADQRQTLRDTNREYRQYLAAIDEGIKGAAGTTSAGLEFKLDELLDLEQLAADALNQGVLGQEVYQQIRNKITTTNRKRQTLADREVKDAEKQLDKQVSEEQKRLEDSMKRREDAIRELMQAGDMPEALEKSNELYREASSAFWLGELPSRTQLTRIERQRSDIRNRGMPAFERAGLSRDDQELFDIDRLAQTNPQAAAQARAEREERLRNDRERLQLERKKEFKERTQQNLLGMASAGIGLFGQAGFPLLNVGFAAMSGPMVGAVAAVTTALGEGSRAVIRFSDSTTEAARSINLVSRQMLLSEGELSAAKAILGALQEPSAERRIEREIEAYTNPATKTFAPFAGEFTNRLRGLPAELFNAIPELTAQSSQEQGGAATAIGEFIGQRIAGSVRDAYMDVSEGRGLAALEQARDQMIRSREGVARFEDPEQMFKRIQEAAASTRGDLERQMFRTYLAKVNEAIEELKKGTKASEETRDAVKGERDGGGMGEFLGLFIEGYANRMNVFK